MAFFKIFGLRFNDPNLPPSTSDGDYLSNLQFARPSDVMTDEAGNPITFGVIGVIYGAAPLPATLDPEETQLFFNTDTDSVWSRTKKADGVTIVDADLGFYSENAMLKTVYDTNDDGSVNAADQLYGGPGVISTASEVRTHLSNLTKHRLINDGITAATSLWSSTKIQAALNAQKHDAADIISGVLDYQRLPSYGTEKGAVPGFTLAQAGYFLRTGGWEYVQVPEFDVVDEEINDMLLFNGYSFVNMETLAGIGIGLDFDYENQTFTVTSVATLEQTRANGNTFGGNVTFTAGTLSGLPTPQAPTEAVNKDFVDSLEIQDLADVSIAYPGLGHMLVHNGVEWENMGLVTRGMLDGEIDLVNSELILSVPYDVIDIMEYPYTSDALVSEYGIHGYLTSDDFLDNVIGKHSRLHGIDSVLDHEGLYGVPEGNIVEFNAEGLFQDSGVDMDELMDAVNLNTSKQHNRQHAIDSSFDHTGVYGAAGGNFMIFDVDGMPIDAGIALNDYGTGTDDIWSADRILAEFSSGFGALAFLDSVGTVEIDDTAVTSAKLADTAVTPGSYTRANIIVNEKGQITYASTSSIAPGESPWMDDGYNIFYTGGFVGINTVNPMEFLHVEGAVYLGDVAEPVDTTNRLYSMGGELFWDKTQLSTDIWYEDSLGLWHDGNVNINGNILVEGQAYHNAVTLAYAANITINFDQGNMYDITLTGSPVFENPLNAEDTTYIIYVKQGGAGSNVPTFGSNWRFASGLSPSWSSVVGSTDILTAVSKGGILSCTVQKDMV